MHFERLYNDLSPLFGRDGPHSPPPPPPPHPRPCFKEARSLGITLRVEIQICVSVRPGQLDSDYP